MTEKLQKQLKPLIYSTIEKLKSKIEESEIKNHWFTEDSINNSLLSLSNQLSSDNFDAWLTPYNLSDLGEDKKVLLVMAGNIPLVGFHDFLSVLISGNKAVVKLSSNDSVLLPYLWEVLCKINPNFSDMIAYAENKFLALKINTNASMINEKLIHSLLS